MMDLPPRSRVGPREPLTVTATSREVDGWRVAAVIAGEKLAEWAVATLNEAARVAIAERWSGRDPAPASTRIAASLPVPPNQEDMLEHRVPYDLATQLLGLIECGVADDLRPAIEGLERGARKTQEDVVRSYEQRWRWLKP